jgi:RNA-directed DNA polymerase
MDKKQIAQLARQLETKEDLLTLLNRIKSDEMAEMDMSDKYHPFSIRLLNYYCNPNNTSSRYRHFKIKKKSGGFRQITAPRNKSFKIILHYVNEIFKAIYVPSDYAMGFTEGRSVVQNADKHKGQNYILNIDLKDFFPSIEQPRVWKRLQLKPFEFPVKIASLLAGLCSMRIKRNDGSFTYVLPQGAPTSPIITNMICDSLDHFLAGLAKRFGLRYSRYADDITFSSMHNVYQPDSAFFIELHRIINAQGFTINEKKTRLQKLGSRQEVTGIVVSNKLNVTQKYVRDIRNILYIWDRYGISIAFSKFFPKYKAEKGHVKKGNPDLVSVLDGKLMYLKMVKGEDDSVYQRLYSKFRKLVDLTCNPQKATSENITYMETTPILEFEKKNSTEIVITKSLPYVRTETDKNNPESTISVNVKSHRYAYFILDKNKIIASVNKSVKAEDENNKKLLAISSCLDAKHKPFWLIHHINKATVPPPPAIDVEELNKELDSLLNTQYG